MKVIDLLNKIANGEEVPEKIKYITTNYIYDSDNQIYYKENYQDIGNYSDLLMELSSHKGIVALNDEVEIIEDTPKEDKKIDKLEIYDDMINWCCNGRVINDTEKDIIDKLNEIIERLNGEDNEYYRN